MKVQNIADLVNSAESLLRTLQDALIRVGSSVIVRIE